MQSRPTKITIRVKRVETGALRVKPNGNGFNGSTFTGQLGCTLQQPTNVICLEEDELGGDDEYSQSYKDAQKQVVAYDPATSYTGQRKAVPDPNRYQPPKPKKLPIKVKRVETSTSRVRTKENGLCGYTFPDQLYSTLQQQPTNVISLEEEDHGTEDEFGQSYENCQNQLVIYDPAANYAGQIEAIPDPCWYQAPAANYAGQVEAIPDPCSYQAPPFHRYFNPHKPSRVLPSVGAFTVQCAICFKWRLIPTKEKYEEIREHILEQYFVCKTAQEWQPGISCEHQSDITQDGSRLWAIDKFNIAQPPPGWQRLLRIRGEGCSKFADVYYLAPSGKSLRSMVDIQKYLLEHPYMAEGVSMSQFSFQIPRPLQENYVRKGNTGPPPPLEPSEVNPLAWAGPDQSADLQLGGQGLYTPYFEAPVFEAVNRPPKKARRHSKSKQRSNINSVHYQQSVNLELFLARSPKKARSSRSKHMRNSNSVY